MLHFVNDYSEGAHPLVLEKLIQTNMESLSGYGTDEYTASAKEKIKLACGGGVQDVYFLVGGTQTNQFTINAMLSPFEGVISAHTGHIGVHEAGAIEFTGHKVLPILGKDGKITASDVKKYLCDFYADESHAHMVSPGMVYISHPTEYGTLYSKESLPLSRTFAENTTFPSILTARDSAMRSHARKTILLCPTSPLFAMHSISAAQRSALSAAKRSFSQRKLPPT